MDELLEGLDNWIDAKQEYDKCADTTEYDTLYYCERELDRVQRAKDKLTTALNSYIRTQVEAYVPRQVTVAEAT